MIIISVFWGLCSGSALYRDGKILGAVSEERFTRKKNDSSFPSNSINWLMGEFKVKAIDIDRIAMVSNDVGMDYILLAKYNWSIDDYLYENKNFWKDKLLKKTKVNKNLYFDVMSHKIDTNQYPSEYWNELVNNKDETPFIRDKNRLVSNFFGVPESKVLNIEHHRSHASYSYYTSEFRNEKILSFTVDGWGDGKNAAIGIFNENGKYEMVSHSTDCNIARIYRYITLLLGMKPGEHEFKVMGLAPYGKEYFAKRALEVFRSTLYVDGLDFKWGIKPDDSYYWFKDRLEGVRFDNIAYALQRWVEELLCDWVKNAIDKYDIHKIVFSGGVSMNVKAMGKISELDQVDDIFIGGSAGDESHIISTAYCAAEECSELWNSNSIETLNNLYLGPNYDKYSEDYIINSLDLEKYDIIENYSNEQVAKLIFDGNIVARCVGSMEFGQRALGNRSILADPSKLEIKEKINFAIKNRDFWMPFAPIIMDKYSNIYLKNPKKIKSPYMTLAFDTTKVGYDSMRAACHPVDRTCRAQILTKEKNSDLYGLLSAFESISGRGCIVNTSFNLHGFPIVSTPKDALYVFDNSDLDCLMLNSYLIIKRRV